MIAETFDEMINLLDEHRKLYRRMARFYASIPDEAEAAGFDIDDLREILKEFSEKSQDMSHSLDDAFTAVIDKCRLWQNHILKLEKPNNQNQGESTE